MATNTGQVLVGIMVGGHRDFSRADKILWRSNQVIAEQIR
jgi:hypothetical protein